jgi:phosphoglycerol transferase MdoB-like AlkP superfamily enzyme
MSTKEIYQAVKSNLYFQLVRRILVIYILYTLCRLVFYWYNHDLYSGRTFSQLLTIFVGGMRFDTTAILYTNVVYILMFLLPFRFRYNRTYQTATKYLYFVTNGITLAANCMDTVYFPFTLRRTTFNIFKEFSNGENLGGVFASAIIENWYLALFFIGLIAFMIWRYGRPLVKTSVRISSPLVYYPLSTFWMALGVGIMIAGFRGGASFSMRPITLSNAAQYITEPIDVPLVLNTPFSIYKTLERKGIIKLTYFDDEMAGNIYTPVHLPSDSAAFKPMNVMVMILESFGKEHWGFYNRHLDGGNYAGYTPFLDSLAAQGLTFKYSYAHGSKSIDALASSLASIPAIPEPFVLSPHFDNKIQALPQLLKEKGYETAFFCGQTNGAMGFTAFCKWMGFEKHFEKNEYDGKDGVWGIWGIWDEEFLQFTAKTMSTLQEPFLTTLFTISSHHPFQIPERYTGLFQEGVLPVHKCIRYSDYALRRFFETARQQPWYSNTLFVLTADHINGIVHDEYKTTPEMFAVPVIFYKPDGSLKDYRHTIAQQLDVTPTVLGYLNYDLPYLAFGFDVNKSADRFAINYTNGTYQLYSDRYVLHFDGQKTTGLYEIHTSMTDNLSGKLPDVQNKFESKMKAFLQEYTYRMVENRLTVNP